MRLGALVGRDAEELLVVLRAVVGRGEVDVVVGTDHEREEVVVLRRLVLADRTVAPRVEQTGLLVQLYQILQGLLVFSKPVVRKALLCCGSRLRVANQHGLQKSLAFHCHVLTSSFDFLSGVAILVIQ